MTVRLRFAPSPTGYLHIGGARTALFSWLYAQHLGGQFILRIEDTDEKRTIEGAVTALMADLRWLGIEWDEGPDIGGPYGPYTQTERAELYQTWAKWLVENGFAYKCFATAEELDQMRKEQEARGEIPSYDRRYRDLPAEKVAELEASGREYVIRFKMPLDGQTIIPDLIRGDIVVENSQLTDYVLLKSSGLPTYHLAHVVDDYYMKITHVTRGEEWLSTAPLHIRLWEAFGWEKPVYAHMPVILNPSGKGKLSKRTQSFQDEAFLVLVRVEEFREHGFYPPAVVNFLTNVGWSFGEDREIFTVAETIERFDIQDVNPAPTKLPYHKLEWLNGQYIQKLSAAELAQHITPFLEKAGYVVDAEKLQLVTPGIMVRLKRFEEAVEWLRFLYEPLPYTAGVEKLTPKQLPLESALLAFQEAQQFVEQVEPFGLEELAAGLQAIGQKYTTNNKPGPFLGVVRLAVTRQEVSPPLFESMLALGRARVAAALAEIVTLLHQS